jgi:uncharacterized membrane protein YfcA
MLQPIILVSMIALGLMAGIVMSLIGASAVMLIVPFLNLFMKFSIHTAIGVSLLVDVISSIFVGYTYFRHGNVLLNQGLWISLGAVIGAQLGSGFTISLPEVFIGISYGLWLIVSGVTIYRKGLDRTEIVRRFQKYLNFRSSSSKAIVSFILGVIIGINSGLFGAGGGILIMFVLIFVMDYPIHKAVGTSTIIMAITALSALTGYWRTGNVDLTASLLIAFGTIVAGVAGAELANVISEQVLAKIVGVIFTVLGVFMTILRFVNII